MGEKPEYKLILDQSFSKGLYEYQIFDMEVFEFLLRHFKSAFSHTSLSIEEAFNEYKEFKTIVETSKDFDAYQHVLTLDYGKKMSILEQMHQMIVFKGSRFGVFNEPMKDEKHIEKIYKKYFSYFDPYLYFYAKFDEYGEFDKVATFHNLDTLFYNLPQTKNARDKATRMQKDHLDAFDYAMSLDEIGIKEVIKINEIVNASDDDINAGYKKTNNDVIGASFTPVDKTNVPIEMQKLFKDYEEGFGLDIQDPTEKDISSEERYNRVCNIIKREAIFHIRFERIHPFSDGNGRTGRIIMNHNLLKYGIAPVLITIAMSDDYKGFIDRNDVDGLTKQLLIASSSQSSNWMSMQSTMPRKEFISNDMLAEIVDSQAVERGKQKRLTAYWNYMKPTNK